MSLQIYSQATCTHCLALKTTLRQHNVPFDDFIIGKDISRDDTLVKFPNAQRVPIVVINGTWVHDYAPAVSQYIAEIQKQPNGCTF